MRAALEAYLTTLNDGESHRHAVLRAAHAVAAEPWDVVHHAGLLARCRPAVAAVTMGLTPSLRKVPMGSRAAVITVPAGHRYPVIEEKRRYGRGVHDVPVDLARRLVEQAHAASDGNVRVGVDLACGAGAFLLALQEAGVPEIYGVDPSPLCVEVAAIACPAARLLVDDPVKHGPPADLVVGAPPFYLRAQVDPIRRFDHRRRFPWLGRVFDVVSGFAAAAGERVRPGGGLGLVLPSDALVRPHGSVWRRRFIERHQVYEVVGPAQLPGRHVDAALLVAQAGSGPALLPSFGLDPAEALQAENVVLDPTRRAGDLAMLATIHASSCSLGAIADVSAGLAVSGPGQRAAPDLLTSRPGEGRVPFASGREFFAGEYRYLLWKPNRLFRATARSLHERPKAVVPRRVGRGLVECKVDRDGIFVGADLTLVAARAEGPPPEAVQALLADPMLRGWLQLQHGRVRDLTPNVVAEIPFPKSWLHGANTSLAEAWGLSEQAAEGLVQRLGV